MITSVAGMPPERRANATTCSGGRTVMPVVIEPHLPTAADTLPGDHQLVLPVPQVLPSLDSAAGTPKNGGSIHLVSVADNRIHPNMMDQLPYNRLPASGEVLMNLQLQLPDVSLLTINNASPAVSRDAGGKQFTSESRQQLLGSLDSLRKFYEQPELALKISVKSQTAGACHAVPQLDCSNCLYQNHTDVKCSSENQCVETHPGLGSLSTLQEFYNGMKRKKKRVRVSGSSSQGTNIASVVTTLSSPMPTVAAYPKSVIDMEQTFDEHATKPSVFSVSHILPVPRPTSRITRPQAKLVLSAEKLCPGRTVQSFEIDRFNSSNSIASTASSTYPSKIPALDNGQPSTLKKIKVVSRSANINSKDSENQDTLSENGAKECSDEITVGKLMIVENGIYSPTKDNTGCEQVTPTGEIQMQSKASTNLYCINNISS